MDKNIGDMINEWFDVGCQAPHRHTPRGLVRLPVAMCWGDEMERSSTHSHLRVVLTGIETRVVSEQVGAMKAFLDAWCGTEKTAAEVFGDVWRNDRQNIMLTVHRTEGYQVLRVWYGMPCSFSSYHVDSMGKNMLFHVVGRGDDMAAFTRGLQAGKRTAQFEDGVTVSFWR